LFPSHYSTHAAYGAVSKIPIGWTITFKDAEDSAVLHEETFKSVNEKAAVPWLVAFQKVCCLGFTPHSCFFHAFYSAGYSSLTCVVLETEKEALKWCFPNTVPIEEKVCCKTATGLRFVLFSAWQLKEKGRIKLS